jgi:hypothetical protein
LVSIIGNPMRQTLSSSQSVTKRVATRLLATLHRPEVVLGMLVAVLHLNIVTSYGRFARQLCVSLVTALSAARAFLALLVVWRASRIGRSSLRSLAVSDFIHWLDLAIVCTPSR